MAAWYMFQMSPALPSIAIYIASPSNSATGHGPSLCPASSHIALQTPRRQQTSGSDCARKSTGEEGTLQGRSTPSTGDHGRGRALCPFLCLELHLYWHPHMTCQSLCHQTTSMNSMPGSFFFWFDAAASFRQQRPRKSIRKTDMISVILGMHAWQRLEILSREIRFANTSKGKQV